MKVELKIYGIFRSGTNLLKLLVEQHLGATCRANAGGHKHLFTPVFWNMEGYVEEDLPVLVCVKDPHAAMVSLYRYARQVDFKHFQCNRTWQGFLAERFVVSIDHYTRPPAFLFRSPVDYWNAHSFHMLSLSDKRRIIIRYEDLLSRPAQVLMSISDRFNVPWQTVGEVRLPERAVKRMGETQPEQPLEQRKFDTAWYLDRQYMEEFSSDQIDYMRGALDVDVMARLGYAFP